MERQNVLEKRLAQMQDCARCDQWECDYCGIQKGNLEHRIERLREEAGVVVWA
jgi:hypothetical protein